MSYGFNAYKQTSVGTASREQILLMLYEAAIKHTKKAISAIESNNVAEKGMAIGKLQDIVNELNNSLNHKVGGEISKNLEQLYNYISEQSTEANIKNDVEPLKSVQKILETLFDAWKEAVAEVKKTGGAPKSKPADGTGA